jgi:hypothetical protein
MNRLAAMLLSLVLLPAAAWADPPARVARLAFIEGEVSVHVDPELGWEPSRVNTHLTGENSVWTQPGARAEVRIGSIALRLAQATQLDIVRLDDEALVAHVPRGSVAVRLSELDPNETVVFTTLGARFQLRGSGRYRIDADDERGESRLTVLSGNARLEVAGGYVSVDTGRTIVVAGGGREGFELQPASSTALDDWAYARDERVAQREAARYVSPNMTGWEDLDDYGVWRSEPEFGPVWFPTRVAVGWAPYRYGRWTWVRPWGWAWVDDAPWGYAPFHYGRWVYVGNRWGWYPGRHHGRPVWAPALVGWVGRPGWSINISAGPTSVVGWYPLSPYERYQPWYAANVTYVNRVNRVVIVDRRDPRGDRDHDRQGRRNDNRDRGATVVARDNFVSRRPVQGAIAPVPREVLATQPIVSGTAVLPSADEWRERARPTEAPRVSGTVPAAPRFPAGQPAEATQPVLKPIHEPAAPLAKPVPQQAQPLAKPVPAPMQPSARPVPAPAQPTFKPIPAPPPPAAKPVPEPAQPVAKPVPPPAPPQAKPVPAPAHPVAKPVPAPAQPMEKPAHVPGQPVAKPVPAPDRPEAKPAANTAQPLEKPAKP